MKLKYASQVTCACACPCGRRGPVGNRAPACQLTLARPIGFPRARGEAGRTSGTTNSWTTPRWRSWTVTLWAATAAAAGGRGACCSSEARALVSRAGRLRRGDAEPAIPSLLHRHPMRALQQRNAHGLPEFSVRQRGVASGVSGTANGNRARTYVVAAGQAIVALLLSVDGRVRPAAAGWGRGCSDGRVRCRRRGGWGDGRERGDRAGRNPRAAGSERIRGLAGWLAAARSPAAR